MLRHRRWWIAGALSLVGVSIAGYAYATSCPETRREDLELQLVGVTIDGLPITDVAGYGTIKGVLQPFGEGFSMELNRQSSGYDRAWFTRAP
jgi:hypothetical protein